MLRRMQQSTFTQHLRKYWVYYALLLGGLLALAIYSAWSQRNTRRRAWAAMQEECSSSIQDAASIAVMVYVHGAVRGPAAAVNVASWFNQACCPLRVRLLVYYAGSPRYDAAAFRGDVEAAMETGQYGTVQQEALHLVYVPEDQDMGRLPAMKLLAREVNSSSTKSAYIIVASDAVLAMPRWDVSFLRLLRRLRAQYSSTTHSSMAITAKGEPKIVLHQVANAAGQILLPTWQLGPDGRLPEVAFRAMPYVDDGAPFRRFRDDDGVELNAHVGLLSGRGATLRTAVPETLALSTAGWFGGAAAILDEAPVFAMNLLAATPRHEDALLSAACSQAGWNLRLCPEILATLVTPPSFSRYAASIQSRAVDPVIKRIMQERLREVRSMRDKRERSAAKQQLREDWRAVKQEPHTRFAECYGPRLWVYEPRDVHGNVVYEESPWRAHDSWDATLANTTRPLDAALPDSAHAFAHFLYTKPHLQHARQATLTTMKHTLLYGFDNVLPATRTKQLQWLNFIGLRVSEHGNHISPRAALGVLPKEPADDISVKFPTRENYDLERTRLMYHPNHEMK